MTDIVRQLIDALSQSHTLAVIGPAQSGKSHGLRTAVQALSQDSIQGMRLVEACSSNMQGSGSLQALRAQVDASPSPVVVVVDAMPQRPERERAEWVEWMEDIKANPRGVKLVFEFRPTLTAAAFMACLPLTSACDALVQVA